MTIQLTQEILDKNVIQVTKALLETGQPPDPMPELAGLMREAPHKLAREGMLKALRQHSHNKPFDDILKRGFDPQPEKPPVKRGLDPQPEKPASSFSNVPSFT